MLSLFPNLRTLNVRGMLDGLDQALLFAITTPNLTKITMDCDHFTKILDYIVAPQLQHLSLSEPMAPSLTFVGLRTLCINLLRDVDMIAMMEFASVSIHSVAMEFTLGCQPIIDSLEFLNGRIAQSNSPIGASPCRALELLRISAATINYAELLFPGVDRITSSFRPLLEQRQALNVQMRGFEPWFQGAHPSSDTLMADFSA